MVTLFLSVFLSFFVLCLVPLANLSHASSQVSFPLQVVVRSEEGEADHDEHEDEGDADGQDVGGEVVASRHVSLDEREHVLEDDLELVEEAGGGGDLLGLLSSKTTLQMKEREKGD